MLMDKREICPEIIGNFIGHMSNHKNVYEVTVRFDPLVVIVKLKDRDNESTESVIDWYIDWQGEHVETVYFDIELE